MCIPVVILNIRRAHGTVGTIYAASYYATFGRKDQPVNAAGPGRASSRAVRLRAEQTDVAPGRRRPARAPAGGRPVPLVNQTYVRCSGDAVGAFPTLRKKSQRGKKMLRPTLMQQ